MLKPAGKLKAVILIPLAAIYLTMAASCSSASTSQDISKVTGNSNKTEQVTLKFINSWGGGDSKADTLQMVFDRFMRDNPDIVVVNESMFGDDFLPKLKTDIASGNNPDVFGLWPGSDIKTLVNAGKVADLTEVLEKDKEWKSSFGDMWSYTTFNNRIYGLPVEIIFECLFINTDLFERYGVSEPKSYEDLKTAVITFREHDVTPIAYNYSAEGTYIYQNILAKLGGKQDVENPFSNGGVDSCYIDAMNYMKDLYQLGAFPEDAYKLTSYDRNNLFKSGKAAMIVQGSWFLGEDEFMKADSKVDVIRFPYINEGKSDRSSIIYGLGAGVFYMSSASEEDPVKREASIRLLKALTSKETATLFAENTGMISNVKIDDSQIGYSRLIKMGQSLLGETRELIGPPDSYIERSVWEDVIVDQFLYVLEGRKTAEEVWNEALKAGATGR